MQFISFWVFFIPPGGVESGQNGNACQAEIRQWVKPISSMFMLYLAKTTYIQLLDKSQYVITMHGISLTKPCAQSFVSRSYQKNDVDSNSLENELSANPS